MVEEAADIALSFGGRRPRKRRLSVSGAIIAYLSILGLGGRSDRGRNRRARCFASRGGSWRGYSGSAIWGGSGFVRHWSSPFLRAGDPLPMTESERPLDIRQRVAHLCPNGRTCGGSCQVGKLVIQERGRVMVNLYVYAALLILAAILLVLFVSSDPFSDCLPRNWSC